MKRAIIFIGLVWALTAQGQQSPLYTQYMNNPYIINPAIAGTVNFFQIRMLSRLQWVGVEDAPVTNSLSVFGPVSARNKDMGYGGTVFIDNTGPTSQMGLRGSFAYNIPIINEETRLSGGLSLGFLQYKFNGISSQYLETSTKDSYLDEKSKIVPDAIIGLYVYSTNYHFGISVDNLFNSQLSSGDSKALGKLKSHFYMIGAYKYIFNRQYALESSIMMKKVVPAPFQFDFAFKFFYLNTYWAGLAFRTQDAVSLLLGAIVNKRYFIGYSYDYNISDIRKYNIGSHEIMVGYRFNSLK